MKEIYVVTLAHARCDENGGSSGGKPGDQTANTTHTQGELRFQDWYLSGNGWDVCMRPKTTEIKDGMASDACKAVRNVKIGYGQDDRYTLYDNAKNVGFDCGKVDKACECDCSSLMTVCANYVGLPIPKGTRTANMQSRYTATKQFKVYTSNKYTKQPDYLKKGDILVRTGHHTAIVVNTLYHMTRQLRLVEGDRMKGKDVKALQQRLNELSNAGLETDGVFGSATDDALVVYQLNNGLEPDGIMGKNTAEKMGFLWY